MRAAQTAFGKLMMGGNLTRGAREGMSELQRRNAELEIRVALLSQTLRQVEAASRRTASAAHDIRNALTVILAEADVLVTSLHDPDQLESAKAVTSAARIVASITQDMLVAARRSEASPDRAVEEPVAEVNTGELMTSSRKLIQRILNPQVECIFTADSALWPVAVQREQLEAALLNLVANARDAMPTGGCARITARNLPKGTPLPCGLPPGNYVSFSVEDTGLGMSPEVLAKATEAFFTTKSRNSGTGLGLAIVKAFATEGGGALHIESDLGRGTRVEILLPRAPTHAGPLDAADARYAIIEKLRKRIRTPWLLDVLNVWSQACSSPGLPSPTRLEAALSEHRSCSLVLAVDLLVEPLELRLIRMGQDLVRMLERSALQEVSLNGPELFGNLAATYRRALRSRCPNYQFARHSFEPGSHLEFERLVLPAAIDGEVVSHLFGVVLMSSNVPHGGSEAHEQSHEQ
jgi:signal transduction histidine kinase